MPLNRVLEYECPHDFSDQVLTFVDRLSMAHSLEVRSAYLDTDFVRFIASLPGHLKIRMARRRLCKTGRAQIFPFRNGPPPERRVSDADYRLDARWSSTIRACDSESRTARHARLFRPEAVYTLVDRLYEPGPITGMSIRSLALVVFQEWYEMYNDVTPCADLDDVINSVYPIWRSISKTARSCRDSPRGLWGNRRAFRLY